METVFQVILILGLVKYSVKASILGHWGGLGAYALCAGLVVMMLYPAIIVMESDVFEKILMDQKHVSAVAVLVTIEAIIGMLISIGMLDNLFSGKKKTLLNLLKYTPGIVVFGSVFYFELAVFRHAAGIGFLDLAIISSLVLSSGVFLAASGIKAILPDQATRYELIFLSNIMLLFLSVLLNAGLADYSSGSYRAEPEPAKLALLAVLTLAGSGLGYILYRYRGKLPWPQQSTTAKQGTNHPNRRHKTGPKPLHKL